MDISCSQYCFKAIREQMPESWFLRWIIYSVPVTGHKLCINFIFAFWKNYLLVIYDVGLLNKKYETIKIPSVFVSNRLTLHNMCTSTSRKS